MDADRLWFSLVEDSNPKEHDLDALLRRMLGDGAAFRPGQREAIEATLVDGARVLVVQATGWGKSIVYWVATRVRRDQGHGPTLIISPLLALMRNQVAMAQSLGIRARTLHSGNRDERPAIQTDLEADEVDVLLVSPERLADDRFRTETLAAIRGDIGLLVVDEVHCISDWGHDFRPDYRRIRSILEALPGSVPILGTTATANRRVVADIADQLGPATQVIAGPLRRDSLRLGAFVLRDQAERLAWLARWIPRLPGTGIVYCLTVADAERVAAWLEHRGIVARAYHGQLNESERVALEDALLRDEVKVLVATVALGMGFDKPDLGFVIHYQRPGSVIGYYQQVGRAGRALDGAYGILLSGREDDEIQQYFIDSAFPPADEMMSVVRLLDGVDAATLGYIESHLDVAPGRLQAILKLLLVEGAIVRTGSRYQRTLQPWEPDLDRVEKVTAQRVAERDQMRAYLHHRGCLMQFLADALDDQGTAACGRCVTEAPATTLDQVEPATVREAAAWLRGAVRVIMPRRKWALGAVPDLNGLLRHPNEMGIALCIYGDAGWGHDVMDGKYRAGHFSDALVEAGAQAIRAHWAPTREGGWWVTAIPSHRNPGLVGEGAERLARALELPYRDGVLSIAHGTAPQKEMFNNAHQLRNVHAGLAVHAAPNPGPVILVDDIVDSRWTLTYAGHLLRSNGSGSVYPFTFAEASTRRDG
ncbi:MAG: RecQ family ATP-dependent DNA helicase [Chloroflexi bacterium]|nr:RecQ family ATP-dependent DNA helicase [Chloroflexota bacterium]